MHDHQSQTGKGFGAKKDDAKKTKYNTKQARQNKKDGNNLGLFNTVIKPLLDIGEFEKAEPTLRLLAQTETKEAEVYEALYKINLKVQNKKEMLYWRDIWLKTDSQSKECTLRQAHEAEKLCLTKLGIEFLEKAFIIDKDDYKNQLNLLDAYLKAEEWRKSKNFILTTFKKPESTIELLWRLAWIEHENKSNLSTLKYLNKISNLKQRKGIQLDNRTEGIIHSIKTASNGLIPSQEDIASCEIFTNRGGSESWPQNRILSVWLYENHKQAKLAYKLTEDALDIQPSSYLLLKQKAILHLMMNDWQKGFEEIHSIDTRKHNNTDKTQINILCDETMGDSLLWSRYIPLLKQQESKKINLYVQPPLVQFMRKNMKEKVKILPIPTFKNHKIDNIGILALPGMVRWNSDFSKNLPLWAADPSIIEEWRIKLKISGDKPLIALNWHGSALKAAKESQITDIPLSAMNPNPFIDSNTFQLVGVQKGVGSEEMINCHFKDKFITEQEQIKKMNSLEQLAAVLSLSDWLICDDSGPAHMAGCLGIKTIVCLPEDTDWRWPANLESPPWYPKTIMLRKKRNEEWASCLQKAWEIVNQWVLSETNIEKA